MAIDALSELEMFDDGEKPWCDLVLEIISVERARDGGLFSGKRALVVRATGTARSREIGIGARIPLQGWEPRRANDESDSPVFHWGHISLLSLGPQTDRLLRLYEEWFELPSTLEAAIGQIKCSAVLLGASPELLDKGSVSSKLFFSTGREQEEECYAELYFNFDLPSRRIWLREKDPEYRAPLTAWLAGRNRQAAEALH